MFGKIPERYSAELLDGKREAEEFVNGMSHDMISDLQPLARIKEGIHAGVNAAGERLTSEERRILIKTENELMKGLMDNYTEETLARLHYLGLKEVRDEILRR